MPTKEATTAPAVPFPPSDIITVKELSARLQCSEHWVYSQMRAGTKNPLPVMRAGGMLRFSWTAVSEWLRGHNVHKKKKAA